MTGLNSDPLDAFHDKEVCPTCAAIHSRNLSRCPECGTFHDAQILSERESKPVPSKIITKPKPVDPGMYSLNPNSEIIDEDLEEIEIDDNTVSWGGGNTDFSLGDFKDKPINVEKKKISKKSLLSENTLEEE